MNNSIETNGCGGKGSWIKPPYNIFFKASCNKHDLSYNKGGDEIARLKSDQGFLRAMLTDCNRLQGVKRFYYRQWSYLYYRAVRWGGKKYFNYC